MVEYALVADIGGTNMRVALVDGEGRVSHRTSTPTLVRQGRDEVMERLVGELGAIMSSAEGCAVVGLGLSLAGPTDPETGVMYNPPNLPGFDGYSPLPVLKERLALDVSAANDATLAALAEQAYGAGRGFRHILYLTLSTGIGGGVVIGGKPYTGHRGFAGEVGHITIDRNGPRCNCGNIGCLEALASGTAVARMARERLASGGASSLHEASRGNLDEVDARMVAQAALAGDALSSAIMDEVSTCLGIGIVGLIHTFDPDVIVLGGGMSESLELLMPGIAREVRSHVMAHQRDGVPIVRAGLGDDASLIGAGALAFEARNESP